VLIFFLIESRTQPLIDYSDADFIFAEPPLPSRQLAEPPSDTARDDLPSTPAVSIIFNPFVSVLQLFIYLSVN